jgi:hypothetical protein
MITGEKSLPSSLRRRVCAVADDSFRRLVKIDESELPKLPDDWVYDMDTLVAVRMKGNCDPHTDDYLGNENRIKAHRSLFWLLKNSSERTSHLIAEGSTTTMSVDDWAFFDDTEMHALMAHGTWVGIAVQAHLPVKKKKK